MKTITINDYTYTSISAAWRAVSPDNLPLVTVRWRLNNGWTPEDAFNLPPVTAKLRRLWKERREMHWMEAAENL
jgi:hypothetical protein